MPHTEFNLETFLPYQLNQAAEVSSLAFQKIYKERYGMLRTEWRVLFHLGLYGKLTASEIGQRASMHKTKISRAVFRLAERRFVERARDTSDRRLEHLTLTDQGRSAYLDLKAVAESYEQALLGHLDPDETALLRQVLSKLAAAKPTDFT